MIASVAPARAGLTITPTFDSSITGDPNAAVIESTINTAIQTYENLFTNPINVSIYFQEGGGLGTSITGVYDLNGFNGNTGYQNFRSGLAAQFAISGNSAQGTALNNLPVQANNPVNNAPDLLVKSADGRALGFNTPGVVTVGSHAYDGQIILNTSLTFPGSPGSSLSYSLLAVAEHEIDEVLGLGSNVGGTGFFVNPAAEDLYRFQHSSTTRNYTTSGDNAWFSINGGTTSLVQFNQDGVGDYGDWHPGSGTTRVQDAYATPGATETILTDGGAEITALNVVGYSLVSTIPEPSSLAIAGLGGILALGYGWIRRRRTAA
jgi:PEP-CTERM motif